MLPPRFLDQLIQDGKPTTYLPELILSQDVLDTDSILETSEALTLICELYEKVKLDLAAVLTQRIIDREFIDTQTLAFSEANQGIGYHDPDYQTVIGKHDEVGRLVVGPYPQSKHTWRRVHQPDWLAGDQVTLFGPPDTAKMSINAMNTLHHRLPNEPDIVAQLVEESHLLPRWGADSEDSKTPLIQSLLAANENLKGCFEGTLTFEDPRRAKKYTLKPEGLAKPIKRIPGLAIPDGHHIWKGKPLPLHLYDFALHLYHNWSTPEALCFYVPKLENEEEARYLHTLISCAEAQIKDLHPSYALGSVRLFIVFENPRAIFRIREIAEELHPFFVGGSLGWHDFLASTARIFRHDPQYRIPVKADPNIVINHIKESHLILHDALAPIGGIALGGMYGTLYEEGNAKSYEVSMVGYIRDVITQMKRGLNGFWVAHPSFVRVGIALVEAWRRGERAGHLNVLEELVRALVPNLVEQEPLLDFILGDDVEGLTPEDPLYLRGVLAADVAPSPLIANSDEAEVRYNIFQALQYLADWLSGNGCVALPALMTNRQGEDVFVRVMDDLATTERSRWELWAEVAHGRVSRADFERILTEEVEMIKSGFDSSSRRIQVRWEGQAEKWYPVAIEILRELVLSQEPPEFVPELILPYTFTLVRKQEDPLSFVKGLGHSKFA